MAKKITPTVAPAGVEWQVLNEACAYQPEAWQDFIAARRERILRFRQRDITVQVVDRAGQPLADQPIRVAQTNSDFLWGFGGWDILNSFRDGTYLREDAERSRHNLATLFNSVNLMHYWVEKHCGRAPSSEEYQGFPYYDNLQQGVDWAMTNNLAPKGHPIFWPVPKAIPDWLTKYDAATRMKFLEVRVRSLTARFRNRIKLYDAINEMLWEPPLSIVEQRHWPHITPVDKMVEYIEPVLRWAREEDPDARYLLNDYGVSVGHTEPITIPTNTGGRINRHQQALRYFKLVQALKKVGAAPDAVGIQGTCFGWGAHDKDEATLDLLGTQTGLPVMITEFGNPGGQIAALQKAGATPDQILQRLGDYVENAIITCFAHPSCEGFYFWYLGEYIIKKESGHPTALYHRLHDLIHKQWRTNMTLCTDKNGVAKFRGFCGTYRLRLHGEPHPHGVGFHVPEASRGPTKLKLVLAS